MKLFPDKKKLKDKSLKGVLEEINRQNDFYKNLKTEECKTKKKKQS